MSNLKKKNFLTLSLVGAGECAAMLMVLLALGCFLLWKELLPMEVMNIIIKMSVFLSVFVSGCTISGARGRGYLLCNAICAISLIACMMLVCALAGEKASYGLWLLENLAVAAAAVLFGTFVQFRHNSHAKRRPKK